MEGLHSEQSSFTNSLTNSGATHRHHHTQPRHTIIQHKIPHRPQLQRHVCTQPQSHKYWVTLLAPSLSPASTLSSRYHTQSRLSPSQMLQTDRVAPGPWGAAPSPARILESGGPGPIGKTALSTNRSSFGQLGSPRDKGGGLEDLCPETLVQARRKTPKISLIFIHAGMRWGPRHRDLVWSRAVPGTPPRDWNKAVPMSL